MKEKEMDLIAGFINRAIQNVDNDTELEKIKKEVKELCSGYPLFKE
jgi:glycine hydroxymethyltransferase